MTLIEDDIDAISDQVYTQVDVGVWTTVWENMDPYSTTFIGESARRVFESVVAYQVWVLSGRHVTDQIRDAARDW